MSSAWIRSPDDPRLAELCRKLAERTAELDRTGAWPQKQLDACARAGVFRWFLSAEQGGFGWSDADVTRGYLALSAACLTTTFILTQRTGACRRIAEGENESLARELLPALLNGASFATVGISHLTTSRRHVAPVAAAQETDDGFLLDGYTPWVTGAAHAEHVVLGATLPDARQILLALPTSLPGVHVPPPASLVGLTASHTGEVRFSKVRVPRRWLVAGPCENVMSSGVGANTGGLQTSTLAVGLAAAAVEYLRGEAVSRGQLAGPAEALGREVDELTGDLLALSQGRQVCTNDALRQQANSLALRTAQAALAVAKGTGYVVGHPAGRWCREALFFLVWSCPQGVVEANLCELAGLE